MSNNINPFRTSILVWVAFILVFTVFSCGIPGVLPLNRSIPFSTISDDTIYVSRNLTLSWNIQIEEQVEYSLYLGKTKEDVELIAEGLIDHFYTPEEPLDENCLYSWQVIAFITDKYDSDKIESSTSDWYEFQTGTSLEPDPKYFLITIGINDYDYANDLNLTDNDADDFERVFSRLNEPYQIKKLTGYVLKSNILEAIETYAAEATAADQLVVTYSGHGHNNTPALLMSNHPNSTKDPLYSAHYKEFNLSPLEFKNMLSLFPGSRVAFIDACYSGYFTQMNLSAVQQSEKLNEIATQFTDVFKDEFESVNNSTAALLASSSRTDSNSDYFIMTAASTDEECFEDKSIKNGLFSYYLTNGLGDCDDPADDYDYSFDADTIKDGEISFFELYGYSKRNVNDLFVQLQSAGSIPSSNSVQETSIFASSPNFILTRYFKSLN